MAIGMIFGDKLQCWVNLWQLRYLSLLLAYLRAKQVRVVWSQRDPKSLRRAILGLYCSAGEQQQLRNAAVRAISSRPGKGRGGRGGFSHKNKTRLRKGRTGWGEGRKKETLLLHKKKGGLCAN